MAVSDVSTRYDIPHVPDIDGAIRNPATPHHFMVAQPVEHFVQNDIDGVCVARTHHALRIIEIGSRVSELRVCFPKADIADGGSTRIWPQNQNSLFTGDQNEKCT
jgi:hypothetical protein